MLLLSLKHKIIVIIYKLLSLSSINSNAVCLIVFVMYGIHKILRFKIRQWMHGKDWKNRFDIALNNDYQFIWMDLNLFEVICKEVIRNCFDLTLRLLITNKKTNTISLHFECFILKLISELHRHILRRFSIVLSLDHGHFQYW